MDPTLVTMDRDACIHLLTEHTVGRLALNDPLGPLVVPVNYHWLDGDILLRSNDGTKLSAARHHQPASLQVDHVVSDRRVGWSVLARGRLSEVTGAELANLGSQVPMPFTARDGEAHIIRLTPRAISGRRIPLPADVPPGWYRETILDSHLFVEDP